MHHSSKRRTTSTHKWIALTGGILLTLALLYFSQLVTLVDETPFSEASSNKAPIVVIDAGHGGHDPGATVDGISEKDLNLIFAKKLELALEAKGIQSLMTRNGDHYLSLQKRTEKGGINKALFIGLHINASKKAEVEGIEIFDLKKGDDPASNALVSHLAKNLNLLEAPPSVTTRHARLDPPSNLQCPGTIVELGFLTNPKELKKLLNENYQNALVTKLTNGITAFIES